MDSIRNALITLKDLLAWLPDPVVAVIILVLAGALAYSLHRTVRTHVTQARVLLRWRRAGGAGHLWRRADDLRAGASIRRQPILRRPPGMIGRGPRSKTAKT